MYSCNVVFASWVSFGQAFPPDSSFGFASVIIRKLRMILVILGSFWVISENLRKTSGCQKMTQLEKKKPVSNTQYGSYTLRVIVSGLYQHIFLLMLFQRFEQYKHTLKIYATRAGVNT